MKLRVLLSILVACLACLQHAPTTHAQCARVRKNWTTLTAQEKTTFIDALQSAMDSGAYPRFVEMHIDMMSEMEAHQQCMFIYWHRLFLLVFENMLRGQGPQYACVTVPYWDWITDHSRYVSGQCRSMGDCSSALADLGGVPGGMRQSASGMYGYRVDGFCVTARPLNHFCERAAQCNRCVPRGNWNADVPPAETSFASVANQIFRASSIGQMSPQLESGSHSRIHADLDGTMSTLLSPADPVFWLHHSMVDVLHVIFHKCKVGTARLSFDQRARHPVAWASCGRRNGGVFNPTDMITMRTGGGVTGRPIVHGSQDPLLGRFFQGVPTRFADLMDTRDLGYTYELSGITSTLYNQCGGTSPTPQPASVPISQPVRRPAPAPAAVAVPVQPSTQRWTFSLKLKRALRATGGFTTETRDPSTSAKVRAADADSSLLVVSHPAKQVALSDEPVTMVASALDPSVQKVSDWYSAMVMAVDGSSEQSLDEIERMMCVYQEECLGGVRDFSSQFKATWGAGSARCKTIVDDFRAGTTGICVADWKEQMIAGFGCPIPATSSSSSNSTSPVQKAV